VPESARPTSPYEICDARLALALDDFSAVLARHDVQELVHFSLYRPPAPRRIARRVVQPLGGEEGARAPAQAVASRHPGGLAIDVAELGKRDGTWLRVRTHFGGRIGARTCGAAAQAPADEPGRELRAIVCEAAGARLFTYVLTPNYNFAHRDHWHMEIKAGVRWFLVH
jgi:hypothetical protein